MSILSAIARALRTVSGESVAGAVLGVTVFCMVLGSSSVPELVRVGSKLRWLALLALVFVSLLLAFRERRRSVGPRLVAVLGLGGWLAAVAVLSTAWSVNPQLTEGRAGSFALLLVAAGALALVARSRERLAERLLVGVLAGTVAAALGGLLLVIVDHARAVQAATDAQPVRLQGLGENPDTAAMLEGLVTPVGLWALGRARGTMWRIASLASLILLVGSISASGSRGGLVAAFVGGIVFVMTQPVSLRRRLALAVALCVGMAGATAGTRIPKPLPPSAAGPPTTQGPHGRKGLPLQVKGLPLQVGQRVGTAEPQYAGRLEDELYRVYTGSRNVFTSSGRLQAWYTAIQQGDARPLLGYGFGTEDRVFLDRVYNFQGSYVENSLIGFYLQLGLVGVLSVVVTFFAVAGSVGGALRRGHAAPDVPALAGVVAGGLALMLVQSYAYSVGNVATASFWIASFVAVGVTAVAETGRSTRTEEGHALAPA